MSETRKVKNLTVSVKVHGIDEAITFADGENGRFGTNAWYSVNNFQAIAVDDKFIPFHAIEKVEITNTTEETITYDDPACNR